METFSKETTMSKITISPANVYAINLLVERMIEANNLSENKDYNCYSEALKAFLINLLGSDLYLEIERLKYGFDWCDGKNACSMLRLWIDEIEQNKQQAERNKQNDVVVDILCNGLWHTVESLAIDSKIDIKTVESILDTYVFECFEVTFKRIDSITHYQIVN
jgi:hypothetical protein